MADEEDSPWKEILEAYFPQFFEFFFPEIHRDIDWSRGCELLDVELERILRDAAVGKRLADKLAKVFLRSGEETWILIHVEVQGYSEADFPERMFVYNVKIFLHYHREVVSLAVLTDDRPGFRPELYERRRGRFELLMRYPVVKLLDYKDKIAELEADPNPFAIVVLAHLKAREARTDEERFAVKMRLARMLYERGYERKDIIRLFRFIDWLTWLPEPLAIEAHNQIVELFEGKTMPYVTQIERIVQERREEIEKAKQEWREQGHQEGLAQGVAQGLHEAIALGLELRFGKEASRLLPRVEALGDVGRLRELKQALLRVDSFSEFEAILEGR
ncbi:MAG: cytosolic protein [Planctomycetes bacterium]|nr:cytosolic protein [Planctomycetota bacterium]